MREFKTASKYAMYLIVFSSLVLISNSCRKSEPLKFTISEEIPDTVGKGLKDRAFKLYVDSLDAIFLDMTGLEDLRMSKEWFDTDANHYGYVYSNEHRLRKIMFADVKPTDYDGEYQKITHGIYDTLRAKVDKKFISVKLLNGLWKNFDNKIFEDNIDGEYTSNSDTTYSLLTIDTTYKIFTILKKIPDNFDIINFSLEDGHNLNLNGYPYFSDSVVFFYKEAPYYNKKTGSDLGYGRIKNKRILNGAVQKVQYIIHELHRENPNEYLLFGEYYPYGETNSVFEMKIFFKK